MVQGNPFPWVISRQYLDIYRTEFVYYKKTVTECDPRDLYIIISKFTTVQKININILEKEK
jgi:hypothetical protein